MGSMVRDLMKTVKLLGLLYIILSCQPQTDSQPTDTNPIERRKTEATSTAKSNSTLRAPISIQEIKTKDGLHTTSSVISKQGLCFAGDSIGFYGLYFLIDDVTEPYFGILTIHDTGEPLKWRADSQTEQFVSINLKSNALAVWDSIQVGINKKALIQFLGEYDYSKEGSVILAELDGYKGKFTLSNDTVSELEIEIRCKNPLNDE
ncbi:MAG: hypothetical protein AAGI38_03720 [Bacteroidota bacterium]